MYIIPLAEPLRDRLVGLLLSEIQEDRCGKSVQENVIHSVVHSFVLAEQYKKKNPLALYENMFEEKLLQDTGDYYRSGLKGWKGVRIADR